MKKLLAQIFLFGFLFFCNPFAGISSEFERIESAPPGCALNVPTNFHLGTVTNTSAELIWSPPAGVPPGTTVTYKVTMYDNTANTALADKYTTGLYYVYDGLTGGHNYTTTVSASACGTSGPYGQATSLNFSTSVIIVDDVAGLGIDNACQPIMQGGYNANQIVTIALPGPGISGNDAPIGHVKLNAGDGSAGLDFLIFAASGLKPELAEKDRNGLARDPGTSNLQGVSQVLYTYSGSQSPFLSIYNPASQYVTPQTAFVTMQFKVSMRFSICGVSYVLGGGDGLVGHIPDLNAPQTNQIQSSINDRNALSDDSAPLQSIQLTPNPTGDRTMLSFSVAQTGPVQLAVYNTMGALVALPVELPEILEKGNYQVEIPSAQLPTGMYFLTLQSAGGRQTVRLVKN